MNHFDFDLADELTKKIGRLLFHGWGCQSEERKRAFYKWISDNSWVEDYATFVVIREEFNMLPWWQWPKEFKIKNNKFLKSWLTKKSEEIRLSLIHISEPTRL